MQFAVLSVLTALANGHMMLKTPYMFRSQFDPQSVDPNIDYDKSPLASDGSNYPCKGYHKDSNRHVVAEYLPGFSYTAEIWGTTPHRGGSCQLSLSYDEGETFYVIKSVIGGCPCPNGVSCSNDLGYEATFPIEFTIPSDAPAKENILFAWSWINLQGNREYYMNCAAVSIKGNSKSGLGGLPELYVTNLQPSCQVPYGETVVFPNPGSDVNYGGSYSSSNPPAGSPIAGCPEYSASLPPVVIEESAREAEL